MNTKKLHIFITLLLTFFTTTSCIETKTSDVKETYKYWSGTEAPADLKLLNGQYWQSPHFSKEYIMYLRFKPTNEWWNEFIKQNSITTEKDSWTIPNDAPNWFKPTENSVRYGGGDHFDQGFRYFRDTISGICLIYEIQL